MDRSLPSSNPGRETCTSAAPASRGKVLIRREPRRRVRRQSRNWLMRLCRYIGVWLALSFAGLALAAESVPRSMLILHPSDVRGPFYYQVFSALRSAVNQRPGSPVTIYLENLDLSRFTGPVYEESLQAHLRVKYRDRPVGVVVAVGPAALEYALRWRPELWPGVPIVFSMVDQWTVAQLKP